MSYSSPSTHPHFAIDRFTGRRKVLSLLGHKFHLYNEQGEVIAFIKQKAFKLKEDIRVYTDESMSVELLRIAARAVLDWSATYDVVDSSTGQVVGSLRRKALKSMVQDEWIVLDAQGGELGMIHEDSLGAALLRRFINIIPQKFTFKLRGRDVGTARQHFNPFVFRISVDFAGDPGREFDRRLAVAAVTLLMAIEGRQDS